MLAVPVNAILVVHVVPDKNDIPATELYRQVKRLKAGVASASNSAKLMHSYIMPAHVHLNRKDAPLVITHIGAKP